MNARRRARLSEIRDRLNELKLDVETMHDQEEDYLDNMPQSFRDSAKGEEVEVTVNRLFDAICGIGDAVEAIEEVQGV